MSRLSILKIGLPLLFAAAPVLAQLHDHAAPATQPVGHKGATLKVPTAMIAEHHHLHEQLAAALASGGKTAEAAKEVEATLTPHFEEEEAYAMPPLGLLEGIAHGQMPSAEQAAAAIAMSDKLRANYRQMLDEHRQVTESLKKLKAAAGDENKPRQVEFAEALMLHGLNEEQILYPAALVLGDYLQLKRAAGDEQPATIDEHSKTKH